MAYTDREDLNYLGQLYAIGANQTPFLNMIGGLNNSKTCKSFFFPVSQPFTPTSGSQPAITEAQSVTGQTPTTITRSQEYNTVQIFQEAFSTSYAKQSAYGEIGGISVNGDQPVVDELAFQKSMALMAIANKMEYSFLQGAYQAASNATTAAKTRGIITASTANTIAASNAGLTKAMINTLLRTMAGNGALFQNMVIFANGFQKQAITDIYGYAPMDRNIGGVNVKQIETDFAMCGVVWCPQMPTDTVLVADLAVCSPMILPVKNQLILVEEKAYVGASDGGQAYVQAGIDYGPKEYHGTITGLKTS